MTDTKELLAERGKTHGDYTVQANTAEDIRSLMMGKAGWGALQSAHRDALHMIAVKISRILSGNPDEPDHWRDIAGYATLAAERCTEAEPNSIAPTYVVCGRWEGDKYIFTTGPAESNS